MSPILFLLMTALEIILAIISCRKAPGQKVWRKNRLFVRLAQIGIAITAVLLPFGQKWRIMPVLMLLCILAVITVLVILIRSKKEEGAKKKSAAIFSCILSIVLIGFSLIPAYIFTGYSGLPTSGKYRVKAASAILVDSARTDPFEQDGSFREVPVHFYYPAEGIDKYPLVIFSHGAFGYYQSNTSTYMELASNGYVVVSLDHPHHAFFAEDTDGNMILVDMDFLNTAMELNESVPAETQYALYTEWMTLRTADMSFVLDQLEAAVKAEAMDQNWSVSESEAETILSVLQMTNIEKIGLMGHSMGGATAVALGRDGNDVDAVVDIDGTMLSEYTGVENGKLTVREDPYSVPVLEFNNWTSYNDRKEYLTQGNVYPNEELIAHAAAGFTTTVRGTEHMDFTDLPMLSPFLGNMLGSGERDTAETMTIVNSLVLEFFNCYLKGEGVFTVQDIY